MFLSRPKVKRIFKPDNRFVVLHGLDEFKDAGEYYFRDGNQIMCSYAPLCDAELEELKNLARQKITGAPSPVSQFSTKDLANLSLPLQCKITDIIDTLSATFQAIVQEDVFAEIRINSSYPPEAHRHIGLTYAFNGPGTLWLGDAQREFFAPTKHILLFDNAILHKSHPYVSYADPKISLVMS